MLKARDLQEAFCEIYTARYREMLDVGAVGVE